MNRPVYTYSAFEGGSTEWTNLIHGARGLSLLQAWAYGEAKAATGPWRIERGIFIKNGTISGLREGGGQNTLLFYPGQIIFTVFPPLDNSTLQ